MQFYWTQLCFVILVYVAVSKKAKFALGSRERKLWDLINDGFFSPTQTNWKDKYSKEIRK